MSPAAQLGIGFGITLGMLSLAGIAAIYIWHRRRTPRNNEDDGGSKKARYYDMLAKMIPFRKYKDNKDDPEWSIESVEKVSIVGNMRAQSVSTNSRSDSRGSGRSTTGGTIPIAMPKRKMSMALTSHPLTPNYTSFPLPPLEARDGLARKDGNKSEDTKPVRWPL